MTSGGPEQHQRCTKRCLVNALQGVSASMIGAVPYTALRFGAYDGLKVLYKRVSGKAR